MASCQRKRGLSCLSFVDSQSSGLRHVEHLRLAVPAADRDLGFRQRLRPHLRAVDRDPPDEAGRFQRRRDRAGRAIAERQHRLRGVARLERQAPTLRRWFQGPVLAGRHRHIDQLFGELEEYFAGTRRNFEIPLVVRGSPFELAVWNALRDIPYGETCSYADVARTIGNPRAVRAVGSANGRNRLPIIIPCHRVVNTGGKLGGYGGGLWRKVRLLEIEGVKV